MKLCQTMTHSSNVDTMSYVNNCHTTSSPRYPKSNGFIERQILYIKPIIKKCIASSDDLNRAMLNVRATPIRSTLPSPAELLFGSRISTTLPGYQHIAVNDDTREHFAHSSNQQQSYHDIKSRELPPLMINQTLRVYNTDVCFFGKIMSNEDERSYKINTEGGRILFRNRTHLRPMVLPEYSTQRYMYENGDRPTNNNVTSVVPDVPSQKQSVSQSPNDSMNKSTQYRTRSGRVTNRLLRYIK